MAEPPVVELLPGVVFTNEGDICWFGIDVTLEVLIILPGLGERDDISA